MIMLLFDKHKHITRSTRLTRTYTVAQHAPIVSSFLTRSREIAIPYSSPLLATRAAQGVKRRARKGQPRMMNDKKAVRKASLEGRLVDTCGDETQGRESAYQCTDCAGACLGNGSAQLTTGTGDKCFCWNRTYLGTKWRWVSDSKGFDVPQTTCGPSFLPQMSARWRSLFAGAR